MNIRETAWRVFSTELNSSSLKIEAVQERSPSYIITPLGAKINRLLISGVMTEKENIGNDDSPLWRAKVQDVNGSFYLNIGKFQQNAFDAIADIDIPCFIICVGRVRTYINDNQKIFVSIRPEYIIKTDEKTRNEWVMETAKSTWRRMNNIKRAISMHITTEADLISIGMSHIEAEGLIYALENYGQMPDSMIYLKTIQNALELLLPNKYIDFGLPQDIPSNTEKDSSMINNDEEMEDKVLRIIEDLDIDGKGAPRDALEKQAEAQGLTSIKLEEISNSLMDKGLVYEPNLRYLKRI